MGVLARVAEFGHLRGPRWAVAEFDAFAKLVELFVGQQRAGLDLVGLGDVEFRVHDALGELCIVGEDEEARGVEIEPADGDDEGLDVLQEVVDGGPAFRIFIRGDEAGGFVEQDINALLAHEGLAVEANFVALHVDPMVGVFNDAAVDVDAAVVDPRASFGAAAEAGF